MDRRTSDRVLEEWDAVTRHAPRPADAPHRRSGLAGLGAAGLIPLAAAALVLAVAVVWLGGRSGPGPNDVGASPSSAPVAVASPSPSPSPSPSASPLPTASPTPSPEPSDGCELVARITSWEGAAGSRIATVILENRGSAPCTLPAVAQPILVDGSGRGLAVGVKAGSEVPTFDLTPGARAETLVQVSNYCGPDPVAPVTVSFEFGDGRGIDAEPRSSDDVTVPPCNGPGQPSEITMHPWSPA